MKARSETLITIKEKLINHIFLSGKKNTSENILLKIVKQLQKISTKNVTKLIQLAILHSLPIFRINKFSRKKKRRRKIIEVPSFIPSEKGRVSRAIKFIIHSSKKKDSFLFIYLAQEMLSNTQSKNQTIENKNDSQKTALGKKNLLKYYKKYN